MYWKYGIAIEQEGLTGPAATNYIPVVKMYLSWLEQTEVGNLLFRAIAREILDAPGALLTKFKTPAQPGFPTRGVRIVPYLGGDCNAEEAGGEVSFSPGSFLGPCWRTMLRVTKNRGLYPQELLFHELVHALRDVSGYGNSLAPLSGGLVGYGDTEEFIAILVTNILMSDPTNKRADGLGLRRDHGKGKLHPWLSDSLDFYRSSRDTFKLIDEFCSENDWFAEKLSEIKTTFNPLTVYYNDQDKARETSRSVVALVRDLVM